MDYRNLDIDDQDESEAKLIAALASGKTVVESAEISGISERTIYRRRKQPDLSRKLAAVGQNEKALKVAEEALRQNDQMEEAIALRRRLRFHPFTPR